MLAVSRASAGAGAPPYKCASVCPGRIFARLRRVAGARGKAVLPVARATSNSRRNFAEAVSGSSTMESGAMPAARAKSRLAARPVCTNFNSASGASFSCALHWSGRPRVCINTTPHRAWAQTPAISASQVNPLTSLMISAPAASAARAVADLYGVDGDHRVGASLENALQYGKAAAPARLLR